MTNWKPYAEWDLLGGGANLLPPDWDEQISHEISVSGMSTVLTGESAQSREETSDYAISVLVVAGEECAARLPWLRLLYERELREFASVAFVKPLYVATDLRASVNINCLRGVGARYEAHVDTNPVTGLLFASDCDATTGGALVFQSSAGADAVVWPRKGLFLAFDAREIKHFVSPLRVSMDRISVPMNYYDDPSKQERPPGLDDRLYTPADGEVRA